MAGEIPGMEEVQMGRLYKCEMCPSYSETEEQLREHVRVGHGHQGSRPESNQISFF